MSCRPILIVDDETHNLASMRQVLSHLRNKLVFAKSGTEALVAALKHNPALILLDVKMPDMDGYTVCRMLKSDPRTESTPVIFVTSLADIGDETRGFEAGAVDYITKPISPAIVRARVHTHLSLVRASQLERSYHDAVYMLGTAGHFFDNDTGVHIWRMAAYSKELAKSIGWEEDECAMLELAAPMHDTGKIGIPENILRKPGKLDENEWAIMQTHTHIGHDILSRSNAPVFEMAASIALSHHEKWDGSGYPHGLKGQDIPLVARIVAIADVFDALSMKRPYKEAWPHDKVMATLIEGDGKHFDPELLAHFNDILPRILDIKRNWDARETHLPGAQAA